MIAEIKRYLILILSILVVTSFAYLANEKKQHQKEIENFQEFAKEANKLKVLKAKWSNKKEDKKLLSQIKSRFKPNSYSQKGTTHILDFKSLDKASFHKLGKMLLNSNLRIKTMDFKKHEAKVSLHVEIII